MTDLTLRPISGPDELPLFTRLPYVLNPELAGDLAAGRRRPHWMWMALRGDRLVARAAWWARAGDPVPQLMDIFDLDGDAADGERLVQAALAALVPPGGRPPEFLRFLPPDWRDDSGALRATEDRMAVLERTGAELFVERLRLEGRSGTAQDVPDIRAATDVGNVPMARAFARAGYVTLSARSTWSGGIREGSRTVSSRDASRRRMDGIRDFSPATLSRRPLGGVPLAPK